MEEIIRLALFYLNGIWRYRWFALGAAAVIAPVGWTYVATMPDVYEARARVYVDTDSVLNPLLRGLAIETNDNRRIYMMTNVLFSRENMEKLARMTDLDLRAKTPREMDDLVADLKSRVHLKLDGNNIYDITFDDAKPALAKRVVQSMLTMFVESNLGSNRQDQDSAQGFLKREVKDYASRLSEAEEKIKDFQIRNFDVLAGRGSYFDRLKSVNAELNTAKQYLEFAVNRRNNLAKELAEVEKEGKLQDQYQYDQSVDQSANTVTGPIDQRIKEMQSKLDDLLLRYTDRHPDVVALRQSIAQLREKAAAERKEYMAKMAGESAKGAATALASNPLYQQMRLRFSEAQADAAAQQARVDDLTKKLAELQKTIDQGFNLETERKKLARNYDVLRKNYDQLSARLEQARLTRQADTSVDTVRFRVLDPPIVPQKPSGPPRVWLSSAVLGVALLVGIGIAVLLSQIRPVYGDRRELNESLGIPVLGSINMIWTDTEKQKRRATNLAFAGGAIALFVAYGLVVTFFFLDLNPFSKMVV